ncbi:hypothetical protein [Candidatus Nanohalobium constans]|nr:hypothetical protein [Candidatus Nanohalobium constans]
MDIVSTFSHGSLREANPFVAYLMSQFGMVPGLIIPKALLVFLPLIWADKNFGRVEADILFKLVFVLGGSMALRNFTLLLL